MPRKDAYHALVKRALEQDGWTITHDPLHLEMGGVNIHIDLGAEGQPIAAEKDGEIWLEHNATDLEVAEELVEAGIPREQIVLGAVLPQSRKFTKYGQ